MKVLSTLLFLISFLVHSKENFELISEVNVQKKYDEKVIESPSNLHSKNKIENRNTSISNIETDTILLLRTIDSFVFSQGFVRRIPDLTNIEEQKAFSYSFTLNNISKVLSYFYPGILKISKKTLDEHFFFPDLNYISEYGHSILEPNEKTLIKIIERFSKLRNYKDKKEKDYIILEGGKNIIRDEVILFKVGRRHWNNNKKISDGMSLLWLFGDSQGLNNGFANLTLTTTQKSDKLNEIDDFMATQGFTRQIPAESSPEALLGFDLKHTLLAQNLWLSSFCVNQQVSYNLVYFPINEFKSTLGYKIINPDKETCRNVILKIDTYRDSPNNDLLYFEICDKYIAAQCGKNYKYPSTQYDENDGQKDEYACKKLAFAIGKYNIYELRKKMEDELKSKNDLILIQSKVNTPKNISELDSMLASKVTITDKLEFLNNTVLTLDSQKPNLSDDEILMYFWLGMSKLFVLIPENMDNSNIPLSEWENILNWLNQYSVIFEKVENNDESYKQKLRSCYLYWMICVRQKLEKQDIQFLKMIVDEFNRDNFTPGSNFYDQCKEIVTNASINQTNQSKAKIVIKNSGQKMSIFDIAGAFSKYMTFDNSSNSNTSTTNSSNGNCSFCNGTGKCGGCAHTIDKPFIEDCHLKSSKEMKYGFVICRDCYGYGYKRESGAKCACNGSSIGYCLGEKCLGSTCQNGWIYCNSCNRNGHGELIGKCSHCKGTGKQ